MACAKVKQHTVPVSLLIYPLSPFPYIWCLEEMNLGFQKLDVLFIILCKLHLLKTIVLM